LIWDERPCRKTKIEILNRFSKQGGGAEKKKKKKKKD